MSEQYTSLGLMSGTSGDGVDASIIQSNGETNFEVIKDKYFVLPVSSVALANRGAHEKRESSQILLISFPLKCLKLDQ